jgi:hypothetical protein
MLTQNRLKELLFYDSGTGLFVRNTSPSNNVKIGDIAGSKQKNGYYMISVDGKKYYSHRLAWLYMFGKFPDKFIDHINQDKSDNRISNLRNVTKSLNSINTPVRSHSQIGYKNIQLDKRDNMYSVVFVRNKKTNYLGRFSNIEEAIAKRDRELCSH